MNTGLDTLQKNYFNNFYLIINYYQLITNSKYIIKQIFKAFSSIYLLLLLFIPYLLNAEVEESYSKKSVRVGEESIFSVKFSKGDIIEWSLPQKGFIFSEGDSETPKGELMDIIQSPTEIKFIYVYYVPGSFKAEVGWKNAKNQLFNSQETLEVTSVLTDEKEILDIAEPFLFSGSYLVRLISIILLGIGMISIIGYILFYFKNKKMKIVKDAIFDKLEVDQKEDFYKIKLQKILLQPEILHKEFIFHLSGYIKERIGNKMQSSVMHLTQSEIHEILQSDYFVANLELLTIDNYFNSVKYMPNEERITRDNALGLVKYWDRILNK